MKKREIKFRAWTNNKMRKIQEMIFTETGGIQGIVFEDMGSGGYIGEDDAVMQFTGLKDDKGVDIYEDDIICIKDFYNPYDRALLPKNHIAIVEYNEKYGQYGVYIRSGRGFYYEGWTAFDEMLKKDVTVVGNVYENPDLLG